jgi:hypothetical protein
LIISDEALSSETGKDTDFVIVLSGEPQGSIKTQRRSPATALRDEQRSNRVPYSRSFSVAPPAARAR